MVIERVIRHFHDSVYKVLTNLQQILVLILYYDFDTFYIITKWSIIEQMMLLKYCWYLGGISDPSMMNVEFLVQYQKRWLLLEKTKLPLKLL